MLAHFGLFRDRSFARRKLSSHSRCFVSSQQSWISKTCLALQVEILLSPESHHNFDRHGVHFRRLQRISSVEIVVWESVTTVIGRKFDRVVLKPGLPTHSIEKFQTLPFWMTLEFLCVPKELFEQVSQGKEVIEQVVSLSSGAHQ